MALKVLFALGIGIAGGWAARSLADSSEGATTRLLEIALDAKERLSHWAAVERERLEDMLAEARLKDEPGPTRRRKTTRDPERKGQSANKRGSRRRGPRLVKNGEPA